jgi:hypothetical protein
VDAFFFFLISNVSYVDAVAYSTLIMVPTFDYCILSPLSLATFWLRHILPSLLVRVCPI